MKITKTKERKGGIGGGELIKFFVDGVLVAECRKGRDFYCTVKNGAPSLIRDKIKNTSHTRWDTEGLRKVVGESFDNEYFKNDSPDLKWGHKGSLLSPAKIKLAINNCLSKTKI